MAEQKTNVMRVLEQKKIKYTPHSYPHGDDAVDGLTVAALLGVDAAKIFKTLVTRGASKGIYVFVIPVGAELDLKKAAKAVGERPGAASGQRQGEAPARADGARRTLPAPREATGRNAAGRERISGRWSAPRPP